MSKVSDLIESGIVVQDPEQKDRVVFNVPIYIKKAAVELGGFEAFAGEYGYQAEIDGEANPVTVHQFCTEVIWNFVRDVFKASMLAQARAQADAQANEQINQLLG